MDIFCIKDKSKKIARRSSRIDRSKKYIIKKKDFNEKYCILCCSSFNLLFKRKVVCQDCQFWICRSCSLWCNSSKQWICRVCEKQKVLNAESRAWIYNRIKSNFGTFGAAKILQNFCRIRRISDSENDSGYGANSDFMPLMKLLSSHSINKDLKMADLSSHEEDCEEEDDDIGDEEELAEIHHSIETILEGLLGGSLDDASVDHLYPSSYLYLNLFSLYHNKLVEVIQNLSKALQKALHNLPSENGVTPTSAHAALKSVIATLVEECQDLPHLQSTEHKEIEQTINLISDFSDVFSSYDSLVAAAVINKVVEESQSRFQSNECTSVDGSINVLETKENGKTCDEFQSTVDHENEIYSEMTTASATGFDLPVECVKIEEIEEITQEFTDSEDDKLSSISKWSNSIQSIDEVGVQKHPDFDMLVGIDLMNEGPTPFPEFGCDLVEEVDNKCNAITCHITAVSSWEDNWLFRKKKRLPLYSNLKYQLLTYCDEPPCMLIPCPSDTSNTFEHSESSSELSETLSAGSLEFSSDMDDHVAEAEVADLALKLQNETFSVSVQQTSTQTVVESSPVALTEVKSCESQGDALCHVNESKSDTISATPQVRKFIKDSKKPETDKKNSQKKHQNYSTNSSKLENEYNATPPRPGTIAEREHKKWLNAVPLKNNPYSAENISKRPSHKSIGKVPISSFKEFERKLSASSETSESSPVNKVNCGPKSIDSELYKRDYYINKEYERNVESLYCLQRSPRRIYSVEDDCFDALSEEALNSFEEKVYISSGKVFTLENHVKRLEREIKDLSPASEMESGQLFMKQNNSQVDNIVANGTLQDFNAASDDESLLPSVKCLATKFIPDPPQRIPEIVSENKVLSNKDKDNEKVKKSRPCMKVHSLTARSLSREFRDLAKQNAPKPMNRTVQVPSQTCEDGTSERESLCSPESVQSSLSNAHPDNAHGYTSDESNTSSCSIPRAKTRKHISRSILQRATYWERRAEQGLLSDASVSEEFPGVDINPD